MKPLRFLIAFFAAACAVTLLSVSQIANAWDETTGTQESRDRLTVSGDYSHFSVNGASLQGTGVRIDFEHFLSQRSAVDVLISTSLTQGASVSSTFTGFGAYYYYSPFSDCCLQNRTVSVNGLPVISEQKAKSSLFQVGVGINEYLLNGSRNVYSASGLGLAAAYTFQMWKQDIKTSLIYSQLSTNGEGVSAIFLTFGLGFNF